MLKLANVTDTYGMRVYTDEGKLFGEVDEIILESNKVFGWKVKAAKQSALQKAFGDIKGVIVPHQFVRAIGDIMIVSRTALPISKEKEETAE